jgi:hypothetical protein
MTVLYSLTRIFKRYRGEKTEIFMKIFHICTISNNLQQYNEMKASFIAAGFSLEKCRYSLFDNFDENKFDPYQTFNIIKDTTVEPYIIFCHQDVVMDRGDGIQNLLALIEELDECDNRWSIAGNAGVNNQYEVVVRITDPNNTANWNGHFPQSVHSLDENFLLIKSAANISTSTDLSGFHFYATDLCLNAIINQHTCYVINFHLTHLSGGNLGAAFLQAQVKFKEKWCDKFFFCYVRTITCVTMCSSRSRILRAIGSHKKVQDWYLRNIPFRPFLISP